MSDIPGQAAVPGNPSSDGINPTPAAATGSAADQPWWSSIPDQDMRGYLETKNFKDPETLAKSYREFEKLQGVPQDRIIKVPDKVDAPEWQGIRERLGFAAPAKPEDYALPVPEGMDPAFANQAAQWMHGAGVPKDMALKIAGPWNEFVASQIKADNERIQAEDAADMTALKGEWGQQFDGSVEMARRAAKEMGTVTGLTDEAIADMEASMGPRAFLKLWAAIGSKTQGEATLHGDNVVRGVMSPDVAKHQLETLKQDKEFFARWSKGDAAAVAQFSNLSRIAAGGPKA